MSTYSSILGTTDFTGDNVFTTNLQTDQIAPLTTNTVYLSGSLDISNDLTIHGNQILIGNQTVDGNLNVIGNITGKVIKAIDPYTPILIHPNNTGNFISIRAQTPISNVLNITIPVPGTDCLFMLTEGDTIMNGSLTNTYQIKSPSVLTDVIDKNANSNILINAPLFFPQLAVSSVTYLDSSQILKSHQLTNGQLIIGSTGNEPAVGTITPTTNQVNVANGPGSITLSLPQNIDTNANVVFNGLDARFIEARSSVNPFVIRSQSLVPYIKFESSNTPVVIGASVASSVPTLGSAAMLICGNGANSSVIALRGSPGATVDEYTIDILNGIEIKRSGTTQFLINNSTGNVSIGNTNDSNKLEVSGTTKTTNLIVDTTTTLSGLTAGQAVITDASKNLASLQYTSSNTLGTLVQRSFIGGNVSVGGLTCTSITNSGSTTLNTLNVSGTSNLHAVNTPSIITCGTLISNGYVYSTTDLTVLGISYLNGMVNCISDLTVSGTSYIGTVNETTTGSGIAFNQKILTNEIVEKTPGHGILLNSNTVVSGNITGNGISFASAPTQYLRDYNDSTISMTWTILGAASNGTSNMRFVRVGKTVLIEIAPFSLTTSSSPTTIGNFIETFVPLSSGYIPVNFPVFCCPRVQYLSGNFSTGQLMIRSDGYIRMYWNDSRSVFPNSSTIGNPEYLSFTYLV